MTFFHGLLSPCFDLIGVFLGLVRLLFVVMFLIQRKSNVFFFLKGVEIDVIDSCAEGNGGCEHDCLHTSEGAVCSCRSGYTLQADGKSCEGQPFN